jgi:hypothetical protein
MKKESMKWMAMIAMALTTAFSLTACGDDDDEPSAGISQKEFGEQCFTIQNGNYHSTAMPSSTSSDKITGISISSQAKAGETSIINIVSEVTYDRFYVGVEGKMGYVEVNAASVTRATTKNYSIPVTFGTDSPGTMKLLVKGKTADGEVTQPYSQNVNIEETFGGDIGTNNIAKVQGIWRYEYEQEDDMGTIRIDLNFMGNSTSGKIADFTLEEGTVEDGSWDDAWRFQVEGQYKLNGSTLRLYFRRVRQKTWQSDWTEWKSEGSAGSVSPIINWQTYYDSWSDYIENGEGNEVWECLVNDAKTQMQLRLLKPVYNYDPVSGETYVSYTYDNNVAYGNTTTRQFKKI